MVRPWKDSIAALRERRARPLSSQRGRTFGQDSVPGTGIQGLVQPRRATGAAAMIASVSIKLSEGRKTVLIMDGPASIFYRGASYEDIRAHGREIIAQADRAESLEATHETLA